MAFMLIQKKWLDNGYATSWLMNTNCANQRVPLKSESWLKPVKNSKKSFKKMKIFAK